MTQYNDAERQAGTMILSELKMFNESVVFFEKHIAPAFWKGLDQCIERFVKTNNWNGVVEFTQKEYVWVAPPGWMIEDDNYKCWFTFIFPEGDDLLLAVISGTQTGETEKEKFGFQFKLNVGGLGGIKKRNDCVSNIDQQYSKELEGMNFRNQGKGYFFLPIRIDTNQLSECWKEYGAFPEDHEVFAPLRLALEKLLKSVDIFDAIFFSEAPTEDR